MKKDENFVKSCIVRKTKGSQIVLYLGAFIILKLSLLGAKFLCYAHFADELIICT